MGSSLIGGFGFSEDLWIQFDDGVETWAAEIVCVDAKKVFGYQIDAGYYSCGECILEIGYRCFDDVLGCLAGFHGGVVRGPHTVSMIVDGLRELRRRSRS
jgi:hypothetical protein